MTTEHAALEAHREKSHAALSSVLWALFLTVIKLVAGLATNSLGILSEALHSGLDLVAAGITFFAVRVAARPADKTHPYGYGKIENLSALAETMLLLVTCGWIIHEAVDRMFFSAPELEPSWWGVGIVLVSLVVDINRAAMLRRVAKKHKSQALEADALHFTTDIWSSGVVLVGLLCVQIGAMLPEDHLLRAPLFMADAIAALFVSGIVVIVGIRLSRKAVTSLLDGGGREHADMLERALQEHLPLYPVRRLRIRESGADVFMDITVDAPSSLQLDAAHEVTRMVEDIAHHIVPGADITVHVEPYGKTEMSILDQVRTTAAAHALSLHHLVFSEEPEGTFIFLHVEVPQDMSLTDAHAQVNAFETALSKQLDNAQVTTHIEPDHRVSGSGLGTTVSLDVIQETLDALLPAFPAVSSVHAVRLTTFGTESLLSFHCMLDGSMTVMQAHDITSLLEQALRAQIPSLNRVIIHTDPLSAETPAYTLLQ